MSEANASRRRADEVVESEATNSGKNLKIRETAIALFSEKVPNLNKYDLVIATLHPYKKSKSFDKMQVLSKVSDMVRKKFIHYFLVKEKNSESPDCHYHLLGYLPKDTDFNPKNIKVWKERVVQLERAADLVSKRDVHEDLLSQESLQHLDYDTVMSEVSKSNQKAFAINYWKSKRSVKDQISSIVSYFTKQDKTMLKYQHYVLQFP